MYFNKLCLSIVILLGVSDGALKVVFGQVLQLYEEFDNLGEYIVVKGYEPDLGKLGFDNRTRSVCVVGCWIFYTELNYNYRNYYSHGLAISNPSTTDLICYNLKDNIFAGKVSSVRFAGLPGFPIDTFSLYEYPEWMGEEEYLTNDQPYLRLAGRHDSIIITGSGRWTVFEGVNYTEPRLCLVPSSSTRILAISYFMFEGIESGALRSVRKGCDHDSSSVVTVHGTQKYDSHSIIPIQSVK